MHERAVGLGWDRGDVAVLQAISPDGSALGDLFARLLVGEYPTPPFSDFRASLDRLVRAGLITIQDEKLTRTASGGAVVGEEEGRYINRILAEAWGRLTDVAIATGTPPWELSRSEYDSAVDYAFARQKKRLTREGLSGEAKWREWRAPWLDFDECLEFLSLIEGEDIFVKVGEVGFIDPGRSEQSGLIGPMLCEVTDSGRVVEFRLHEDGKPTGTLRLVEDSFRGADFVSFDGLDYFTLDMVFGDSSVRVEDANRNR